MKLECTFCFEITAEPIETLALRQALQADTVGAFVCFEGLVRDHAEGRAVAGLEFEVYPVLALKEGRRIMEEARDRFAIQGAHCVHRVGALDIRDCAVWIGVTAGHRAAAFDACRYIIDELKVRVPVWKKERFVEGDTHWVNCAGCAAHAH